MQSTMDPVFHSWKSATLKENKKEKEKEKEEEKWLSFPYN